MRPNDTQPWNRVSLGEMLVCAASEQVLTQLETVLQAQQDQSSTTLTAQPDRQCEMLARVKEYDGDDNKLFAEYQQDIESDLDRSSRVVLQIRFGDI